MSEQKFTPGPWHRNIRANGKYPVIFAGRNTHVAVAKQMETPEETEANIDLIAAAPDLLAALEANHEHHMEYGADYEYEGSELYKQNLAAITKATA